MSTAGMDRSVGIDDPGTIGEGEMRRYLSLAANDAALAALTYNRMKLRDNPSSLAGRALILFHAGRILYYGLRAYRKRSGGA